MRSWSGASGRWGTIRRYLFERTGDPVRQGPITQHLVGQGPCALPWVREKFGSGRRGRRPLRKRILWCVGEGLSCPSRGRGRTPPLRRSCKRRGKRIPSHGVTVPAPFRQGGRGDGGCGLPRALCALAMTVFLQGAGARPGGRGRTPPLRRGCKRRGKRIPQSRLRRASPL